MSALAAQPLPECLDERAITSDAAAEYDASPAECRGGSRSLFDEGIDERILKGARDRRTVGWVRATHGVQYGGLEPRERHVVVVCVARHLIPAHHRSGEAKARRIALSGESFDMRPARIRQLEELRDLVECFTRCIVSSAAEET